MNRIILLVLAAVIFACGLAHASATSEVSTYIDWAGMYVENGDSAGLVWSPVYGAAYTYAGNNFGDSPEQVIRVWDGSDVYISNTATNAFSAGYTRPDSPYSIGAVAWTRADGTPITNAHAAASTQNRDWFTVREDATLTFNFNYSVWQNIQTDGPDEGGSAYSFASLYLLGPQNDFDNPIDYTDFSHSLGSGIYEYGDTFSVSGSFIAGEWYSLEAHSYGACSAYAPQGNVVPEPATMVLFGIGTAAAALLKRKNKIL